MPGPAREGASTYEYTCTVHLHEHAFITPARLLPPPPPVCPPRVALSCPCAASASCTHLDRARGWQERENAAKALQHAQYRLKEGRDSLDMPDMSNCVIS